MIPFDHAKQLIRLGQRLERIRIEPYRPQETRPAGFKPLGSLPIGLRKLWALGQALVWEFDSLKREIETFAHFEADQVGYEVDGIIDSPTPIRAAYEFFADPDRLRAFKRMARVEAYLPTKEALIGMVEDLFCEEFERRFPAFDPEDMVYYNDWSFARKVDVEKYLDDEIDRATADFEAIFEEWMGIPEFEIVCPPPAPWIHHGMHGDFNPGILFFALRA